MTGSIIVIALVVLSLLGTVIVCRDQAGIKSQKFAGRASLSDKAFYELYMKMKAGDISYEQVIETRNGIAQELGYDQTKLLPEDTLESLGPEKGHWIFDDELHIYLLGYPFDDSRHNRLYGIDREKPQPIVIAAMKEIAQSIYIPLRSFVERKASRKTARRLQT